jgi:maltose alpha-D-glucosyltransferase/alpha-amylase
MSTPKQRNPRSAAKKPADHPLPLAHDWAEIFTGHARTAFMVALRQWLPSRRWFRGKARVIDSVKVSELITVPISRQTAFLVLFQVNYTEGEPELYVLPLACAFGKKAREIRHAWPRSILTRVSQSRPRQDGVLYDAIVDKQFCHSLLAMTSHRHTITGNAGALEAEPTSVLRKIRREQGLDIEPSVSKAEQSNSSIIYGNSLILKFFRRLDMGTNPELEIERFLAACSFPYSPPLAGALEYHDKRGRTSTMAVLTSFVPGCHDAWQDTLYALRHFYDRVQRLPARLRVAPSAAEALGAIFGQAALPRKPADLIGTYLRDAKTLGRRTAALHLALASDSKDPSFRPEPWTAEAQQSLFESMRDLTHHNYHLIRQHVAMLPASTRILAKKVLPFESLIVNRFQQITVSPLGAVRIRTHGDYHLGQVLHHGGDFLIIDFEGEPAVSLEERRSKQSALRDVAGMIYSFFYAAHAALRELPRSRLGARETRTAWARYWAVWAGTAFLRAYLETAGSAPFIPADQRALKVVLDVELLRKAIYELGYELNNRPDWVNITFQVLLDLFNPDNPI